MPPNATPPPGAGRVVECVADVAGDVNDLEETERDVVVSTAAAFDPRVSLLKPPGEAACYLQGEPDARAHPDYPGVPGVYAFSCTTFAHYCYEKVRPLIDLARLPVVSQEERTLFAGLGLRTQKEDFRRLACGHLICALEPTSQRFPFRPAKGDWAACADTVTFDRLLRDDGSKPPQAPPKAPGGGGAGRRAAGLLTRLGRAILRMVR